MLSVTYIFIHLNISIKLFMFEPLYPQKIKMVFLLHLGIVHILINILVNFHKNCWTLRVAGKWRDCL